MRPVALTAVLLLSACQPRARRLLVLDLALSEPALLNGTVQPWRDEGYHVEYRRFYPHLARADLDRYRVLLFLLGREPEAPSDAITAGDLALLTEWVLRGGVAVLGYDADGEGYLDRWTANRWLEFLGTGISIGDRLLEDTTVRALTTTGRSQPWVEARTVGDEPLGSPLGEVYEAFPLDRNNVVAVRDHAALLAVTSRHAFVRAPRPSRAPPSPRGAAGVVAAARVGDGLVLVISRHALGALGPQFRPTTAPLQQPDALERTRGFLSALARWTRRPAEWAHVPPAARGVPVALQQAPIPVELDRRSEEHTSELQSQSNLVCRLLLEKKKKQSKNVLDDRGQRIVVVFDSAQPMLHVVPQHQHEQSVGGATALLDPCSEVVGFRPPCLA